MPAKTCNNHPISEAGGDRSGAFGMAANRCLVLVAALAGEDLIRAAYAEAVRRRYRFFSYGDAMLIL